MKHLRVFSLCLGSLIAVVALSGVLEAKKRLFVANFYSNKLGIVGSSVLYPQEWGLEFQAKGNNAKCVDAVYLTDDFAHSMKVCGINGEPSATGAACTYDEFGNLDVAAAINGAALMLSTFTGKQFNDALGGGKLKIDVWVCGEKTPLSGYYVNPLAAY